LFASISSPGFTSSSFTFNPYGVVWVGSFDADYELRSVSKREALKQFKKAKEFVELITKEIEK